MLSNEFGYTFKSLGGNKRDSHTVSSGDIDNDGDLDLVFAGETSKGVAFGFNDGQGNFSWDPIWIDIHESFTSEIVDLNRDGNFDLIISGRFYDDRDIKGLYVLWGSGNGLFSWDYSTPIYNNFKSYREDGSTVTGPDDLVFNDIDKDGFLDVITVYWNNEKSVLETFKGSSDFKFTNNTSDWFDNNITNSTWVWLYLSDIDKNKKIDLYDPSKFRGEAYEWSGYKFIKK